LSSGSKILLASKPAMGMLIDWTLTRTSVIKANTRPGFQRDDSPPPLPQPVLGPQKLPDDLDRGFNFDLFANDLGGHSSLHDKVA
jgi:hypothetical protein